MENSEGAEDPSLIDLTFNCIISEGCDDAMVKI